MYTAPTSLTAVKSAAERSMSAPEPERDDDHLRVGAGGVPETVASAAGRPARRPG